MMYTTANLFQGNLEERRQNQMTSFDLIWRLTMLLLNNNESQEENKE